MKPEQLAIKGNKEKGYTSVESKTSRNRRSRASSSTDSLAVNGTLPMIVFSPKPILPSELYPFVVDDSQLTVQIIRHSRRGITRSKIDEVASLAKLTNREMAKVLNMAIRTLQDKKATHVLNTDASERLLLLEQLLQHGLSVFDGNRDALASWLRTPITELSIRDEPLSVVEIPRATRQMGRFGNPYDMGATLDKDRQRTSQVAIPTPQTPLDILDTISGFKLVENVLGRIETGVFS